MKRTFFLLMLALFAAGCKNKNSFSVRGVINGKARNYISIFRIDVNTPVFLDSSKVHKNGAFRFKVRASDADFYQLGFSQTDFITLLANPGEQIKLRFSSPNLYENYTIEGSAGSSKLQQLDLVLTDTKRKLDSLTNLYNKVAGESDFAIKGPVLESEFTNLIKSQRRKNIEFILNNITSLASIKALYQTITPDTYVLYEPNDLQYLKIVTDSLKRYYPNSKHVQALARNLNNELNRRYAEKLGAMASQLPESKLDPDLKSLNGNRIALSSLRGKYVLLAFWSYLSKECLVENLQLKEYYKVYKNKGFEIYQINVDESAADWEKAVKFDELPWISTREDDPRNPANVRLFNVTTLPANYLFDRAGKIIASNLHDRALQLKLEQLFEK